MGRLSQLEHYEIRDVDNVVDRANSDALDFRAQPLRTGPHLHVVDAVCGKKRAIPAGCYGDTFLLEGRRSAGFFCRRRAPAEDRPERLPKKFLPGQRGDFPSQTVVTKQIAAVWRDLDVKNRIARKQIGDGRAYFRFRRQNQKTSCIRAKSELDRAAKHSFAVDPAEFAFSD